MSIERPEASDQAIELTRSLTRRMAREIAGKGVAEVDILTGISFALHDLVAGSLGDPVAAFEWQRTAIDVLEQAHMEGRYSVEPTSD